MIEQYVVFGECATHRAADGAWKELKKVIETETDHIGKRKFKTEDERLAYLRGLNDMAGWMDCYPLSKDEAKKMLQHLKQEEIDDMDSELF